jgi:hypothetical protein
MCLVPDSFQIHRLAVRLCKFGFLALFRAGFWKRRVRFYDGAVEPLIPCRLHEPHETRTCSFIGPLSLASSLSLVCSSALGTSAGLMDSTWNPTPCISTLTSQPYLGSKLVGFKFARDIEECSDMVSKSFPPFENDYKGSETLNSGG